MKRRGNNEGSIYHRKDGRWEARIATGTINPSTGKPKQTTKYFKRKKEAQGWLAQMSCDVRKGIYVEPTKITLNDWLERFMEAYQSTCVAPSTYNLRSMLIRLYVRDSIGMIQLSKLQPNDIQRIYTKMATNGGQNGKALSTQTIRHLHNTLNPALKQAVKEGLLYRNPVDSCQPPRVIRTKEMEILDQQGITKFLKQASGHRLFAAFLLDLATGLRRGELLGLQWDDVDFNTGTIRVQRSLARVKPPGEEKSYLELRPTKTKASRRLIPVPTSVMKELKSHKARQAEEKLRLGVAYHDKNLVFATADGNPIEPSNLYRLYSHILDDAKLKHIPFHSLRHSFATMLLTQGENPKVVQEMLGHTSIVMTMDTYSSVVPGLKEAAAKRLDSVFEQAMSVNE